MKKCLKQMKNFSFFHFNIIFLMNKGFILFFNSSKIYFFLIYFKMNNNNVRDSKDYAKLIIIYIVFFIVNCGLFIFVFSTGINQIKKFSEYVNNSSTIQIVLIILPLCLAIVQCIFTIIYTLVIWKSNKNQSNFKKIFILINLFIIIFIACIFIWNIYGHINFLNSWKDVDYETRNKIEHNLECCIECIYEERNNGYDYKYKGMY